MDLPNATSEGSRAQRSRRAPSGDQEPTSRAGTRGFGCPTGEACSDSEATAEA